jgi:RNA polymerase sigma-70 factor (ECF subfamily)
MTPPSVDSGGQFVGLLTSHQRQLFVYVLSLVGDETHANDILQNTNQVLWSKRAEFAPNTSFSAWASRVAYWQVMDFIKRRKLDRHLFDDELLGQVAEAVHETAESAGSRLDFLQQCMEELPQQLRAMVRRRYEPGVTIDQLAQQQGRSVAAVSQALHRVRHRLLQCIEGKLAIEGEP